MTRTQAQTLLKRYGFDNSDPLNDWLDEGQTMFEDSHDWPFLQQTATINPAAGASTLVFPSDFFKIHSVRDMTNQTKLQVMDHHTFDRDVTDPTDTGQARNYIIIGTNVIQLWPVLDSAVTFRVIYQRELTDISALAGDGSNLDGPARTHYPMVLAAAYTALMAENEEERATTALQQFQSAVDTRWRKYSTVDSDEPRQVQDVMGYFG